MKRGGVAYALAELRVHADLFGQQCREAPDPLDVRARVLVAELDRHRQPSDRLGLRDLELRQRPAQLGRTVADLSLQRLAMMLPGEPSDGPGGERKHEHAHGRHGRPSRKHRAHARRQRQNDRGHPAPPSGNEAPTLLLDFAHIVRCLAHWPGLAFGISGICLESRTGPFSALPIAGSFHTFSFSTV